MKNWYLFCLVTIFNIGFSQSIQLKNALKSVYNFEKTENYTEAKTVFSNFLKEKNNINSEISFAQSYLLFYDYLLSDYSNISSVDKSISNLLRVTNRKPHETELLINLYTAKCHFVANSGTWQESLDVAELGYKLKDFNQAKLETKTDYLYDLGFLYDKAGNSFEGIKFYKKSLELYIKQFGEINKEVALNYNNLAFAYNNVSNQKNTIKYYTKAASIWEKTVGTYKEERDYLVTVYHNLINEYVNYGDTLKAKEFGNKLTNYLKNKYGTNFSENLSKNSELYGSYVLSSIRIDLATNNFEAAKKLLENYANKITTDTKSKIDYQYLLQSFSEIIDYCNLQNKCNQGVMFGLKALELAKKIQEKYYLVLLNSKISASYSCLNQYELALKHLNLSQINNTSKKFSSNKYILALEKVAINEKLNHKIDTKAVKENIENLVFDLSKKQKEFKKIEFKDIKELVSPNFIKLFYKSGALYFKNYKATKSKNDLEVAFKLYQISSKIFNEYYQKGEFNEELNKYHSEITEGLLEIAIEKKLTFNEKIELINSIERNASQHLAKAFFKKIQFNTSKNSQTILAISDLKSELYFYKNQKQTTKTIKSIQDLEKNISNLLTQTSKTYQETEKNSLENFDVHQVQKAILEDEIIIKYYTFTNSVFVIDLTSTNIEIKKVGDSKLIKSQVTTFLNQTKSINNDCLNTSKRLFDTFNLNQNFKKITIIPDGFLNYFPFETLFDAKKNEFLVENHSLSYNYSLPIWLFNKQNNIEVKNTNLIAFSPNYNNNQTGEIRTGLSDLKYAKQEATVISALFKGETFLNEKASKSQFLNSINNFGLFHFSMHSLLYEDNFNESCLVFANNEKLFFSELYELNFPAKLAVLSACDTGNGALKSGEGIMSISRAMAYAGVQSSVYSLWQVPDKETSEIMISFYENLKKGQPKDVALANAKTIFIANNPLKKNPFYWAGFVVNGNISPVINDNSWIIYAGICLALFLLIFWIVKSKLIQFRK